MPSLTKRQQVLLDRLVTFGQWLTEERLPVHVLEAYGFGSFFRGKGTPRDVDLMLRHATGETGEFLLFSELLDKVCDGSYSERFKTPQAALLHVFDERYSNLIPGLIDVGDQRRLFEQWVDGYTWSMLFTDDPVRELAWRSSTEVARRFVKRNLANLNISRWIGPDVPADQSGLRAGFVVLLWSPERPDIRANVEAALRDDHRHGSILDDLIRFDHDLFRLETQADLTKRAFQRLLRTPRSRQRADSHHDWLRVWAKRQKGVNTEALRTAIFADALDSQERLIEQLGVQYPVISYQGLSVDQIGELAEQKRSRLKVLRFYIQVAQEAIRLTAWYKSNQTVRERNPKDFLFRQILCNKGVDWWKKGLPVLADLGLEIPQHLLDTFCRKRPSRLPRGGG